MKSIVFTLALLGLTSATTQDCPKLPIEKYCGAFNTITDGLMQISVVAPHLTRHNDYGIPNKFEIINTAGDVLRQGHKCGVVGIDAKHLANHGELRAKVVAYVLKVDDDLRNLAKKDLPMETQMGIKAYVGEGAAHLDDEIVRRVINVGCKDYQ